MSWLVWLSMASHSAQYGLPYLLVMAAKSRHVSSYTLPYTVRTAITGRPDFLDKVFEHRPGHGGVA